MENDIVNERRQSFEGVICRLDCLLYVSESFLDPTFGL